MTAATSTAAARYEYGGRTFTSVSALFSAALRDSVDVDDPNFIRRLAEQEDAQRRKTLAVRKLPPEAAAARLRCRGVEEAGGGGEARTRARPDTAFLARLVSGGDSTAGRKRRRPSPGGSAQGGSGVGLEVIDPRGEHSTKRCGDDDAALGLDYRPGRPGAWRHDGFEAEVAAELHRRWGAHKAQARAEEAPDAAASEEPRARRRRRCQGETLSFSISDD
eukprot:Hpha_TRINITY_DN16862_c2_g5::TRINITY_DN16862_c2_g5_i2::g.150648::m.150648